MLNVEIPREVNGRRNKGHSIFKGHTKSMSEFE